MNTCILFTAIVLANIYLFYATHRGFTGVKALQLFSTKSATIIRNVPAVECSSRGEMMVVGNEIGRKFYN